MEACVRPEATQGFRSARNHAPPHVRPDCAYADPGSLEEDAPRAAKGVAEPTAHGNAGQVHEGPGKLRMEGDGEGERPEGDLAGFHPGAVHPVDDPA